VTEACELVKIIILYKHSSVGSFLKRLPSPLQDVFNEQYAVVFQPLLYFWHRSRPLLLTLHAQQTHQHPANTSQPSYFLQHYHQILVCSVGDVCLFLAANAGSNGGISGATHHATDSWQPTASVRQQQPSTCLTTLAQGAHVR